jgi:S1-C subfamily serine protease
MLNNSYARDGTSSAKWKYASVALVALLVISSVLFYYAYLDISSQLSDTQRQLANLNNKLQIIEYLNKTSSLPLPQIFDALQHSVVLITTNLGQGSGFVYDDAGHIITNHHVIEDAASIRVTFIDGNVTEAHVVGDDPYSDLAIVKVTPSIATLHPVVLGNSSDLIVGEPVVAIGNPFGLSDTMTAGIVSQLGRELSAPGGYVIIDVIQVDAAINPGNSGGPLVNMNGEVVGVNTAILSETGTFAGIGFAIPSDTVKRELPSLLETGAFAHPWIGIRGLDVNLDIADEMDLEKVQGFLIFEVLADSPAEEAGLRGGDRTIMIGGQEVVLGGDVIIGVDGLSARNLNDLVVYIERNKRPGDTVDLRIIRDGEEITILLTLGERP